MVAVIVAIVVAVILLLSAIAVSIYNRLVTLKNVCDNGFAQIDVQLRRRYDLIPNLVECVKAYMGHERETLEAVIAARNQASTGLQRAAQDPSNGQNMQSWMASEGALTGALGKLNFVMEAYPEVKANENVAALFEELTSTENRVAFARQAYNDWVMGFNTYRESFPAVAFAGALGFPDRRAVLEDEDPTAISQAPVVSLA